MIEWTDTPQSSNIARVGYDPDAQEMTVEFKSGGSYVYSGVGEATAADMAGDSSPGKYFQRHIHNHYTARKL